MRPCRPGRQKVRLEYLQALFNLRFKAGAGIARVRNRPDEIAIGNGAASASSSA